MMRLAALIASWTPVASGRASNIIPMALQPYAFRGSVTFLDWLRDFQGLMILDPQLGGVEEGFMAGMRDVFAHVVDEIKSPNRKALYLTGHSLGAARALLLGGLIAQYPDVLHSVVTFGSPRPGGQKLKDILRPVEIASYRNGTDPVPDVPLYIPEFEPYLHPRQMIQLNCPPDADDPWGTVAPHHIQYYVRALEG
jgi:hypothetical protein